MFGIDYGAAFSGKLVKYAGNYSSSLSGPRIQEKTKALGIY